MAKFSEIILDGKKNGKTLEEINAALKEAGATFHLENLSEAELVAKKLKEQEEGFLPGEEPLMVDGCLAVMADDGKPIKMIDHSGHDSVKSPTMARDMSRAGKVIHAAGYELTYDENGYCKSMTRMK